jgi:hypothetical protein
MLEREKKRRNMKRIWRSWNKLNFPTKLGLFLSAINITIAIISKNLLYFIISLPAFFFFIYEAQKDLKVKRNGVNKK